MTLYLYFHGDALLHTLTGELPTAPIAFNEPIDEIESEVVDSVRILTARVPKQPPPPDHEWRSLRRVLPDLQPEQFYRYSRALQLLEWHHTYRFCSRCGSPALRHGTELAIACTVCDQLHYPRVNPCVIVAIYRENQLLLARAHRFQIPMFSLIAGYVEVGETLEQAVKREVLEEVGLTVDNIQYVRSQPWPYPTNLMLGFTARYVSGEIVLEEAEIAEAAFFDPSALPLIPPVGSIARSLIDELCAQLRSESE